MGNVITTIPSAPTAGTSPTSVTSTPQTQSQAQEYLPYGWEVRVTPEGRKVYVDHVSRSTHWTPPWLPPGWEMLIDPVTRTPFYLCLSTGSSQWSAPLPPGWTMLFEPRYGRPFLRDASGASSWNHPGNSVVVASCSTPSVAPQPVLQRMPTGTFESCKLGGGGSGEAKRTESGKQGGGAQGVERLVCKVCMEREIDVVLLPCGHLCVDSGCAAALKNCPICRGDIRQVQRVFQT